MLIKNKIIMFILVLISVVTVGIGFYFNNLPNLYLIGLSLFYLVFDIVIFFLIKRKNKFISFIGVLLSLIVIIVSIILSFIFIRVQLLFNNISDRKQEFDTYGVIVLKSSDYKYINDIDSKSLGYLKNGDSNYNKAFKRLKMECKALYSDYDNVLVLAKKLFNNEVVAIFLNKAYITILDEGIEDFSSNVKILNEVRVKKKSEAEKNNKVDIDKNKSFNVYISGIDTYGNIDSVSRSDVNVIATVNLNSENILLTNIPRDMYVELAGKDGYRDKLTHAGVYGINTSIRTIENFLDIDINYYARINFSSLIRLVDYIGGIDVYSDYSFSVAGYDFEAGMNYNLSGKEALAFSRDRYSFKDVDRQRGRNQEKVIAAIISKVTNSYDINTYLNLINTLESNFQTNMDRDMMNKLIYMQLKNNYRWNISFSEVNGYDSFNYTYSYPWQKLYVMEVDKNSLNRAKIKIKEVIAK